MPSSIRANPLLRVTFSTDIQDANARLPIIVTPSGITIFCKLLHPSNASSPITLSVEGRLISYKAHHRNAWLPIYTSCSGSFILSSARHPENVSSLISFIPILSDTSLSFGQFMNILSGNSVSPSPTENFSILSQPTNARFPIEVTLFGNDTSVREVQLE